MGHVPSYWWDFESAAGRVTGVIVESDDDRFPVVGRFVLGDQDAAADLQVSMAERMIADLKAGRADPRKLAKAV